MMIASVRVVLQAVTTDEPAAAPYNFHRAHFED